MSDISVDIGQVVLDGVGVAPRSGERFGRQIESTLQRVLEHQGLPPGFGGRDVAEFTGLTMTLPPGASKEQIARELTRALYYVLGNEG